MDEKIIIKSEQYNVKKFFRTMVIIGVVLSLILAIILSCCFISQGESLGNIWIILTVLVFGLIPVAFFSLVGGLIYLWLHSYEMTVTDKRIFGKVAWGKRIDLPVDSVSAVATSSMKGIAVATSSGRIAFKLIKNVDAISEAIGQLIIERQNKAKAEAPAKQETATSTADELKKFKDLLDNGIITQEEVDTKKKQLLGL